MTNAYRLKMKQKDYLSKRVKVIVLLLIIIQTYLCSILNFKKWHCVFPMKKNLICWNLTFIVTEMQILHYKDILKITLKDNSQVQIRLFPKIVMNLRNYGSFEQPRQKNYEKDNIERVINVLIKMVNILNNYTQ